MAYYALAGTHIRHKWRITSANAIDNSERVVHGGVMASKTTAKPRKTQRNAISEDVGVNDREVIAMLIEDAVETNQRLDHLEYLVAALMVQGARSGSN